MPYNPLIRVAEIRVKSKQKTYCPKCQSASRRVQLCLASKNLLSKKPASACHKALQKFLTFEMLEIEKTYWLKCQP